MKTTPKSRAEAGPVPVWASGDPLTFTARMQTRLRDAVLAVVRDPELADQPDSVRLAAVLTLAKTNAAERTAKIRAGELGRWLGVEATTISHSVRPRLKKTIVRSRDIKTEHGTIGIEWMLVPYMTARHSGAANHPLRLSKVELATLLRLCEALFGPGWTDTPPGLLADRTGHGAATARLALLLAVLHSRMDGTVRLRSGSVDKHGRLAATVAQFLARTPAESAGKTALQRDAAEGKRVLRDLTACEVLVPGSGARDQLVVPAVREAYRRLRAAKRAAGKSPVVPRPRAADAPKKTAGSAGGDQNHDGEAKQQVEPGFDGESAEGASATHHAVHTPVGTTELDGADGMGGFSGSAVSGEGRQRGSACAHEDRDGHGAPGIPGQQARSHEGPLRGEKPDQPVKTTVEKPAVPAPRPSLPSAVSTEEKAHGKPKLADPAWQPGSGIPSDVRTILAPLQTLLTALQPGALAKPVKATRAELKRITVALSVETVDGAAEAAEQLLARRIQRHLADQGGPARIDSVIGWLLRRGLPSRCCNRCDDGVLLDSAAPCPSSTEAIDELRAVRRTVAAAVRADMPHADETEIRAEINRRLPAASAAVGREAVARHRANAEFWAREEAKLAAAATARAAAEHARKSQPCVDCAAPAAGGLCSTCSSNREIGELRTQTVMTMVAAAITEPTHLEEAARLTAQAEQTVDQELEAAQAEARRRGADAEMASAARWLTITNLASDARTRALALLGGTPAAGAEASAARTTSLLANPTGNRAQAAAAADRVAAAARTRTAEYLLHTRMATIRDTLTPAEPAEPAEPGATATGRCTGQGGTCTGRPLGRAALCLDCRAFPTTTTPAPAPSTTGPAPCPGWDGTPCGRNSAQGLCVRCRTKTLTATGA
ncbi:hypothetical protein ACFC1B_07080 [Streptomyces xiamenensis]|uniref:hypothetical protein n=1 Tax=Streptomyces xiamenensis TaxID=408015 RepID=UPI0035DF03BE